MRALVINLDAATERLEMMRTQLDALEIDWERLDATGLAQIDPPLGDRIWQSWERPLRQTEMAGMCSHLLAWQRVSDSGQPWLILEDDALLDKSVPTFLETVSGLAGLEHISLETRGRAKYLDPKPHSKAPIQRLRLDRSGAAAYVLWPSGARKLVTRSAKTRGLADALLCAEPGLRSWQAVPALAIQLDQCARYGAPAPIATVSQIDALAIPTRERTIRQRIRRVLSQLRMGIRQVGPKSVRTDVLPKGDWVLDTNAAS